MSYPCVCHFFIVTLRTFSNVRMKRFNIPFSPPDMTEAEVNEVREAILSGWITTGPRTKELEREIAAYVGTERAVCLNSQTACAEMALRLLGIGEGDEVIVPAYTYTASASAAIHCGATVKFVDIRKDGDPVTHMPEMDYKKLEAAITEKTKAIVTVDLGGIVCNNSIRTAGDDLTADIQAPVYWLRMYEAMERTVEPTSGVPVKTVSTR